MLKRKIWSLVLTLIIVVGTISPAFGVTLDRQNDLPAKITFTEPDEIVRVIVELEEAPILDRSGTRGMSLSEINSDYLASETAKLIAVQNEVKDDILVLSHDVTFRHTYVKSYNGFSADLKSSLISEIQALDNVKSVHIANRYEKPEPQMLTSGGMVNVNSMWNLGYEGEGMLVAVLDTGIDYQHQDFVLTNPGNAKLDQNDITDLLANNDLAVEEFAASQSLAITSADLYKSSKVPFAFDYADIDTDPKPDMTKPQASIHGVHVSGTVAANGNIKGIAPEAQIATMKIFSDDSPYAYEDDIVAGIEDAILIGADVINMSLGATAGFTDDTDPEQQAIANAKNAGLVVAVSAGNSARFGEGSGFPNDFTFPWNPDTGLLGSPSAGTGTFSVASIENIMAMSPYALSADSDKMQYMPAGNTDPTSVFNAGPVEYVYCGLGAVADFEGKTLTGKIALISRGSYAFVDKINNAIAAGAAGVIVFNNSGNSMISMAYPDGETIPAIFIGQTDGNKLVNATVKTVSFDPTYVDSFANPTAGTISDFSSWGPTPSLEFKPEITAPGGDIYSTVNDNKYESMSGTSMAAPHIAGASAIMLEYIRDQFPGLTAVEQGKLAKALMMSTAVPVIDYDTEYSPRQQGAGLLDLEAAVNTDVYAYSTLSTDDAKLALGEIGSQFSFQVTLDNFSGNNHEFAVSVSALTDAVGMYSGIPVNAGYSMDLTGAVVTVSGNNVKTAEITTVGVYQITPAVAPSTVNVFNAIDASTTSGATMVIVPVSANSTETVTVNVDLSGIDPSLYDYCFNGFFADGFVQFLSLAETDDNPNLSIPYMGFVGDWEDASVFDDDIYMGPDWSYFYPQFQSMISVVDIGNSVYDGFFLGVNSIADTASYENIAISPNGDGVNDNAAVLMSMLRNIESLNVFIADENQNPLEFISLNEVGFLRKPFLSNGNFIPYEFPTPDNELASIIWDGTLNNELAPEGQYYYVVEANIAGGFGTQYFAYPVYVDYSEPSVTNRALSNNQLTLTTYDNHAIKSYELIDAQSNVVVESATNVLDVTGLNLNELHLIVTDYAGNQAVTTAAPNSVVVVPPAPSNPESPSTPSTPSVPGTTELPYSNNGSASLVTVPAETITEQIKQATGNEVILKLPATINTDKPIEVNIPASSLKELLAAGKELVIQGSEVSFKLSGNITNLDKATKLVFSMNPTKVEDYNVESGVTPSGIVYDFNITLDGEKVTEFGTRPEITVTLPKGTASASKLGAYVQNEDGTWTYVMSFYDAATNTVSFKAPHFSTYALMSFSKTFDDIQGHWGQANIEEMASKYVVSGVSESTFAPNKNVNRAEFVAMILKAMGETPEGNTTFTDVTADKWYAGYLAKAADLGLIDANSDGSINPLENITREEIATITAKAHALINNIKLTDKTPSVTFSDASSITDGNAMYVGYVQSKGIIVGYNNLFRPSDLSTRAEAVSIIKSMLEK